MYSIYLFICFRQRVYGVTTASVKVGYQYSDCKDIMWDVQTTKLSGHDMSISEVGGWNLDIHHRYNFHEGIYLLEFCFSCVNLFFPPQTQNKC